MKFTIKTFLLLFLNSALFAQSDQSLVKNWTSHQISKIEPTIPSSNALYQFVFLKDGEVKTSNSNPRTKGDEWPFNFTFKFTPSEFMEMIMMKGRKIVVEVHDGYLIGFNGGEIGSSLYWFSKDGQQNYRVTHRNIVQFIKRNDKIYAIEGLGHMYWDSGSMLLISNYQGKWIAKKYVDIPYAPMAAGLDDDNNVIVATSSALISIDAKANIKVLEEYAKWQPSKQQTSLVVNDGMVYVGMKGGIFKLNLKTKKTEWLLTN